MKKTIIAVSTVLAVGALLVVTAGADISINIPTTAKQDVKLAKVLDKLNLNREVPYVSIEEALKEKLIRDVKQMIRVIDEKEHRNIFTAWESADEATKDQIRALLGVQ